MSDDTTEEVVDVPIDATVAQALTVVLAAASIAGAALDGDAPAMSNHVLALADFADAETVSACVLIVSEWHESIRQLVIQPEEVQQ